MTAIPVAVMTVRTVITAEEEENSVSGKSKTNYEGIILISKREREQ